MVLRSWRSQANGSAGALGEVADTMLTRTTPCGLSSTPTLLSLLTTRSGQSGQYMSTPFSRNGPGTGSGSPLARLATMSLSPRLATLALRKVTE